LQTLGGMFRRLAVALLVGAVVPSFVAAAPGVQLTIRDGQVWLTTERATVGQILAEWARIGGTEIVNGDRVPGGPYTLALNGVSEQEALDVVLRAAGGFVAVGRSAALGIDGAASASRFKRIVIVSGGAASSAGSNTRSVSAAPRAPAYAPPPPPVEPVVSAPEVGTRIIGPDGQPVPDDQEDAPPPGNSMPPGFSPPPDEAPPPVTQPAPTTMPTIPPGVARPGMMPPPPPPGAPVQPRRPGRIDR